MNFAIRQRSTLLVLAAISDAQALERSLADTDVLDAAGDITIWLRMATDGMHKASCR